MHCSSSLHILHILRIHMNSARCPHSIFRTRIRVKAAVDEKPALRSSKSMRGPVHRLLADDNVGQVGPGHDFRGRVEYIQVADDAWEECK